MASEDRSFLKIDLENLEEEWVNQPELYNEWSEQLADAQSDYETAKANLEVAKAEAAKEIRNNPKKFGLDKTTDKVVSDEVTLHPEVRKMVKRAIKARHRVDVLKGLQTALDHRKKALENAVNLHGQGYFAVPRAKGEYGHEVASDAKKKKAIRRSKQKRKE